jgi:soluble lytic murein transglycosylase
MRALRLLTVLGGVLALMPGIAREGARAEAEPPAITAAPAAGTSTELLADEAGRYDPSRVWLGDSSAEQRVRDALDEGNKEQARALGDSALWSADAASHGRLLWLLARTEGTPEAAEARLHLLRQSAHPLARWAALREGESLLARQPALAVPIALPLTHDWPGARDARVLLARAYHSSGNDAAAEPLLRTLVEQSLPRSPAATVVLPLADILATRGTPDALRQALALYRRVGARAAGFDNGDQADKLAKRVLARMRPKDRALLAWPSTEDELARGDALMTAHQYEPAQKVLDKLVARLRRDPQNRCKAELEAGRALFYRREREQAAKRLSAVAKHCDDIEIKAWARYLAGSSRQRTSDPKGAIAEYEALLREAPEHSLADDALLLEASAQKDAGDEAAARSLLERMLERYPHGDMHEEARFALAFDARARGDQTAALEQLERALTDDQKESGEGLEGRAAYWRARTLQDLGRTAEAKSAYLELARALPLSYHAQQALARLFEIDPKAHAALLAELSTQGVPEEPLRFAWRKELDTPGWKTAVELLRVGEIELARRELTALGVLGEGADSDTLWLAAATLDAAHAYSDASQLVRARLRSFRSTAPRGRARQLWRIAYPRAYSPLIEQAAAEVQVPPELVRAIAREESDFNPDAVSSALAYGLIQLIIPTARIYAQALGLPSDPDALKRPAINLRIGSHFIQELWQRYTPNPAVLPAAYNAGYVATDRWLRETPGQTLDEWIERIPYRETRRYTRRVLQSYGVYAWLERGQLPPLARTLPPASTPAR